MSQVHTSILLKRPRRSASARSSARLTYCLFGFSPQKFAQISMIYATNGLSKEIVTKTQPIWFSTVGRAVKCAHREKLVSFVILSSLFSFCLSILIHCKHMFCYKLCMAVCIIVKNKVCKLQGLCSRSTCTQDTINYL